MTEAEKDEKVAELTELYLEKRRAGEAVTVKSFVADYPELAEELTELLEVLSDMETLNTSRNQRRLTDISHYPDQLGDFRLLDRIGSGGMGTVFRAIQQSLNREVAVKILSPVWSADSRHSEAFEKESQLIAALRHTNIVEVFGAGQEGEFRYYVMGLVKGQGVSAGRLPRAFPGVPYEVAVARVGVQAAKALAYAHAHGVLHRDVKPGNLLLDDAGVVHVTDFGLATVLNDGEAAPLVTQNYDGTLRYMPPERLLRAVPDFAEDQYSLGLTLYELLKREPAFRETAPGKLIHRISSEPLPLLRGFGELGAVINKSISFRPKDRYASMQAMAEDLQRYLNGLPVQARPVSPCRRYFMWVQRRPWLALWSHAAALMVVLLLVSISIGYISVHRALVLAQEQRNRAEKNAEEALAATELALAQRSRAEKNAQIADAAMQRIFTIPSTDLQSEDSTVAVPSREEIQMMLDLLPYYEDIVAQSDVYDVHKVSSACHILASFSLQLGEYRTAEQFYRRATELYPFGCAAYIRAMSGLAASIYAQGDRNRYSEAEKLLQSTIAQVKPEDEEARKDLLDAHLLLVRHLRRDRSEEGLEYQRRCREGAAHYLMELLKDFPEDVRVNLRRVGMLVNLRQSAVLAILAPNGETPVSLINQLLEKHPDNTECRRLYLRLALMPTVVSASAGVKINLARAAGYAESLLADSPSDTGLLMMFLRVRDRYTIELQAEGKNEEARLMNERTLGILSFLISRSDFTPEDRERLVFLVANRTSRAGADSEQQEKEILTLLNHFDDDRAEIIRKRLQQQKSGRRGLPRRPAPGSK